MKKKKEWYKTWWGVLLFVFFLPFAVTYFVLTNKTLNKLTKAFILIAVWGILFILSYETPEERIENEKENAARIEIQKEENKKTELEKQIKNNLPEVSQWDAVAYAVKTYVKTDFYDPDIDYIEASNIASLSNGMWFQRVKIRGKNAFGAKIIQNLGFLIIGKGENAKVVASDDYAKILKELEEEGVTIAKVYDLNGKEVK